MPLVKIFARSTLAKPVPLAAIQSKLCDIWGTKPNTTKLILQRVEDWTDESFQEDVYVDIRAYGMSLLYALVPACSILDFLDSLLGSFRKISILTLFIKPLLKQEKTNVLVNSSWKE